MPIANRALIDRFVERANRADAVVHELDGWEAVARLAAELAGDDRVIVAPAVAARAGAHLAAVLGEQLYVVGPGDSARDLADAAVGVVAGRVAVAETGSVLLLEPDPADRYVSMLSRTLVQVVLPGSVVAGLEEAGEVIGAAVAGYAVLVTGPSRTADIERSLTIGVQGPAAVHVVLLS